MVLPVNPRADRFNAVMNQLVGKPTGQTFNAPRQSTFAPNNVRRQARNRQSAIQTRLNFLEQTQRDIDNFRDDSNDLYGDPVIPNPELVEPKQAKEDQSGLLENAKDIGGSIKNVGGSLLGAVGDIASRPLYGVHDAMLHTQQALDEGQTWSILDDWGQGIVDGVTGKDKTTPGMVQEYMSDPTVDRSKRVDGIADIISATSNPYYASSQASKLARETWGQNNEASKWINIIAGFTGEVLMDPLNLVGGKVVSQAAKTGSKALSKAENVALAGKFGTKAAARTTKEVKPGKTKVIASGDAVTRDVLQEVETAAVRVAIDKIADEAPTLAAALSRKTPGGVGGARPVLEKVGSAMADAADNSLLSSGGRRVAAANGLTRAHITSEGVMRAREEVFTPLYRKTDAIKNGTSKLDPGDLGDAGNAAYRKAVDNDPVFKAFDDEYRKLVGEDLQSPLEELIDEAVRRAELQFNDEFAALGREIEKAIDGNLYNTWALRVGRKEIPIKVMGRGYQALKSSRVGKYMKPPNAFSYNRQLPGMLGLHAGNSRRNGHRAFEEMRNKLNPIVKQLTRKQKAEVGRLYHKQMRPDDPLMAQAYDLLEEGYKKIHADEIVAGVRSQYKKLPNGKVVGSPRVANYQYLQFDDKLFNDIKPGFKNRQKAIDRIKDQRSKEILRNPDNPMFDLSPQDFADKGFNVTTDPFEALARRKLKSERAIAHSYVTDSFFRTYGFASNTIDDATAQALNLRKIKHGQGGYVLNQKLQNYADEAGDLFLPDDVADAFDNYHRLATTANNSEELNNYLRAYDKALNFFKLGATIPFPGFHVKNMAGDMWMGYLDGVKAADYTRYTRMFRGDTITMPNSGVKMSKSEFKDIFGKHGASGGFLESEIFPSAHFSDSGVTGIARRGGQKVRAGSEWREDFGRGVHFLHAMDEELARLGIKEITPEVLQSRAFEKAMNNSTYRINKFKFDYGALTRTEKQVARRTIPFYTFLRKSAPLMLEGMMLNPSQFGKYHRFFDDEGTYGELAAPWQREIGFAAIGNSDEPLLLPGNIIPVDFLTSWGKDPLSLSNFADNFINSMTPALKAPIELGTGRSAFTGQELFDGEAPGVMDTLGYLMDTNVPLAKNLRDQALFPALDAAGIRDNSGARGVDVGDWEELIGGSRFALGLGARRLESQDQRNNLRSNLGGYKEDLDKYNIGLKPYGIKIFVSERSDGTSVKVRETTGKRKDIFNGDLQGALDFAEKYVKNPRNKTNEADEIVQFVDRSEGRVTYGPRRDVKEGIDRIVNPDRYER